MRLYADPAYAAMAEAVGARTGATSGAWHAGRFANGELYLDVGDGARGETCVMLGGIAPPDVHLLTGLWLAHTLARGGARRVIAAWPYLAYGRQDRDEPGRSRATAWLGTTLPASGVDAVVTVDIHSACAAGLLGVPVRSLSPAPVWADVIRQLGWTDAQVVAPDAGAMARAEAVRRAAGLEGPVLACAKTRTEAGVRTTFDGQARERVVLVDDILDTGATLVACCEGLRAAGARVALVLVTHGLFTGTAWRRLWDLGVLRICCTDSVPPPPGTTDPRIARYPVGPLLADALEELDHGEYA